jgi:hypothetical protein
MRQLDTPCRVPLISVCSRVDNVVMPNTSADYGDQVEWVDGYSHMGMLFSAPTFQVIAGYLPPVAASGTRAA